LCHHGKDLSEEAKDGIEDTVEGCSDGENGGGDAFEFQQ